MNSVKGEGRHDEAIRLYVGGLGCHIIAGRLNIGRTTIKRWIKASGVMRGQRTVSVQIKQEVERLYRDGQTIGAIAAAIGKSMTATGAIIHRLGIARSRSEAQAFCAARRRAHPVKGGWWQSSKTGKWEVAQSVYELVRMSQLDEDASVLTWTRQARSVLYGEGRRYIPDFTVTYTDGRVVVEEVKPKSLVARYRNPEKFAAATAFFRVDGIDFRVITEDDLGEKVIRAFSIGGLQGITPEEKRIRKLQYWRDYHANKKKRVA